MSHIGPSTNRFGKLVLQATLVICCLSASVFACESPPTFKPRVVAGIVCHLYAPVEIQQLLKDVQEEYKRPLNDFGAELHRSIDRRFSDRLQIPYPKGLLVVDTPLGVDYWYCEQSFTVEGAREIIDEFAAQWQSEEKMERPNYEVEISILSPESWSLAMNNLTWTPKLVEMTDAEKKETGRRLKTEWSVSKRPGRSVWFRFHEDWLWSSYSENLLVAETLDLIPESRVLGDAAEGKLFAQAWFNPDQLSEQLRGSFLTAVDAVLAVQSQQRDGELAEQSHPRRVWNGCRAALARAALNDVESAEIQISSSPDQISLHAEIITRNGSASSDFLSQTVPGRIDSLPPMLQVPRIAFRLIARIPEPALSLFQRDDHTDGAAPMDLFADGSVTCDALEELNGWLSVRCSDPRRFLRAVTDVVPEVVDYEIRHPILNEIPIHVSTTIDSSETMLETLLTGPLFEGDPADDTHLTGTVSSGEIQLRRAVCELHADATTIESLMRHWFPAKAQETAAQSHVESTIDVKARVQSGANGLTLDLQCAKPIAHRVFAALVISKQPIGDVQ